jgi:hypothetical protein
MKEALMDNHMKEIIEHIQVIIDNSEHAINHPQFSLIAWEAKKALGKLTAYQQANPAGDGWMDERQAFIAWYLREFGIDVTFNLDHGDIHTNKLFKCFRAGYGQDRQPIMQNLRKVKGPLNTEMWEAPDGQGGQFADPSVALKCWQARVIPTPPEDKSNEGERV